MGDSSGHSMHMILKKSLWRPTKQEFLAISEQIKKCTKLAYKDKSSNLKI